MYTQQFIKSVKKIFFVICMAVLGNKFSKGRLFIDKITIETVIKIRQIWKHTSPSANRLTAVHVIIFNRTRKSVDQPALLCRIPDINKYIQFASI